jgi:mannose-1-phosphate guanylyltransferase
MTFLEKGEQRQLSKRWGIVLAGGDGVRLRSFTRMICGDERPKQFCPLLNGKTLLEQTLRRAELTISRERLLVSLTAHHHRWYLSESALHPDRRIVQPTNKGTAPPIAHSLLSIAKIDENAVVAILPSDHHYTNEPLLAKALEAAFEGAEQHPDSVVLLGARPDSPEVDYGWIEAGASVSTSADLFRVTGFQEKPNIEVARQLLSRGALWNTFVLVGSVRAFLEMIEAALPELMRTLCSVASWAGAETHIEESFYRRVSPSNLSHHVLSAEPGRLLTLRLGDVGWSDLGDPARASMAARSVNGGQELSISKPAVRTEKSSGAESGSLLPLAEAASA